MSARLFLPPLPDQGAAGAFERQRATRRAGAMARSRSIAATAWTVIADIFRELRRLNQLGRDMEEFANGSRYSRARVIRERLNSGYRGQTPCC